MDKEYKAGWNELETGSLVLIFPDGKKPLFLPYHKAKNGQRYYSILLNPEETSDRSVWYKTKNLDKAKEVRLNQIRKSLQDKIDFINKL